VSKPLRRPYDVLAALSSLAVECTKKDLRMGQAIQNALDVHGIKDPFYLEDQRFAEIIRSYAEEVK
jgi:hypothetical protein